MGDELTKFMEKHNIETLFSMVKDMEMTDDTDEGIDLFGSLVEEFYKKNRSKISINSIKVDDLNKMFIQDMMVKKLDNETSGWFSQHYSK